MPSQPKKHKTDKDVEPSVCQLYVGIENLILCRWDFEISVLRSTVRLDLII